MYKDKIPKYVFYIIKVVMLLKQEYKQTWNFNLCKSLLNKVAIIINFVNILQLHSVKTNDCFLSNIVHYLMLRLFIIT